MLIQKYNYKNLKRKNINKKRHYIVEGEISPTPVPSVTTILSETAPEEDKQAIKNWRKRVGYAKANSISTESAGRGTRVHKYLENFILNGKLAKPGTNPYSKQANLMAESIINNGLVNVSEIWGTEVPLCFPKIYAGTSDCAGVHQGDETIIDFKQSNKIKKREWLDGYFLQTVAYGEAHNELYGTNIRKGVIIMITPDLDYLEFIIENKEYEKFRKEWWRRVEQYYLISN